MSIRRACWVFCDWPGCDETVPYDMGAPTVRDARDQAKDDDWKRINGKDYCPIDALAHSNTPNDELTREVQE